MRSQLIIAVSVLITISNVCIAQDTTHSGKPSYFKIGGAAKSNSVWLGRKDTAAIPYISPYIGYSHKSGFYTDLSVSYLPKSPSRIDVMTVEAGYWKQITKHFSFDAYAGGYFYNALSKSVQSSTSGSASVGLGYDLPKICSFSGSVGSAISSKPDLSASFGAEHSIDISNKKSEASITPSFVINAGTQRWFEEGTAYIKTKNGGKGRGSGNSSGSNGSGSNGSGNSGGSTTTMVTTTKSNSAFHVLDYEISIPVKGESKHFGWNVTPYYSIPVNAAILESGTTVVRETLSNSFYISADIYWKL